MKRKLVKTGVALATCGALLVPVTVAAQSQEPNKARQQRADRKAACGGFPGIRPRVVEAQLKMQTKDGFQQLRVDSGEVTAADADSLTIKRADGQNVSVSKAAATRTCRDGKKSSFDAVEPGDKAQLVRSDSGELKMVGARSKDFMPRKRPASETRREKAGSSSGRRSDQSRSR